MLSDEERIALAQEALDEAWALWVKRGLAPLEPDKALVVGDESYPVFQSDPRPQFGRMLYHYTPGYVAPNILAYCEQVFERAGLVANMSADEQKELVKRMATTTLYDLLVHLHKRLADAIEMAVDESLLFAETALIGVQSHLHGGLTDTTRAVEELVDRYASRQRERLARRLKKIPDTRVPGDYAKLPKITHGRVRIAFQNREKNGGANLGNIASELKVSAKQLSRWVRQQGYKKWKDYERQRLRLEEKRT